MTPYYDDGTCVIYHGDCREIVASLMFGAIVTDPPYGVSLGARWRDRMAGVADQPTSRGRRSTEMLGWEKNHAPVAGDDEAFDPAFLLGFNVPTVLFGANNYASRLPDSGGWIVWDKARGGTICPNWKTAAAELAWTNKTRGVIKVFSHLWHGYKRDSEIGQHFHPTQKPVALMRWVFTNYTQPTDVTVDPFMGSGTTLRAAKDLGRRAIGIEIEEKYCEIAAKRLAQEVLPLEAL